MANSVTARFNDNCKVFVSMSDDTTVEKAVIIDADGNETDIGGGGGSSDFSTAQITFINHTTKYPSIYGSSTVSEVDDFTGTYPAMVPEPNTTSTYNLVLYKGVGVIINGSSQLIDVESGEAEKMGDELTVSGDCTIGIYEQGD